MPIRPIPNNRQRLSAVSFFFVGLRPLNSPQFATAQEATEKAAHALSLTLLVSFRCCTVVVAPPAVTLLIMPNLPPLHRTLYHSSYAFSLSLRSVTNLIPSARFSVHLELAAVRSRLPSVRYNVALDLYRTNSRLHSFIGRFKMSEVVEIDVLKITASAAALRVLGANVTPLVSRDLGGRSSEPGRTLRRIISY